VRKKTKKYWSLVTRSSGTTRACPSQPKPLKKPERKAWPVPVEAQPCAAPRPPKPNFPSSSSFSPQ